MSDVCRSCSLSITRLDGDCRASNILSTVVVYHGTMVMEFCVTLNTFCACESMFSKAFFLFFVLERPGALQSSVVMSDFCETITVHLILVL